jgi:hypothetical protein
VEGERGITMCAMLLNCGECPQCNENSLEYGDLEHQDTQFYYECNCSECGWEGKEWYNSNFSGYTDNEGNELGPQL